MTSTLTWDIVQELIARKDATCLTVLMPTSPSEPPHADQTQLRHLLLKAEALLHGQGVVAQATQHFLESASQLAQCDEFWRNRKHGLALFVADDFLRWYFVDRALPSSVTLSSQFYIKPLLPLAQRQCHFHVLALSQTHVALWHYDACAEAAQPVPLAHGQNGLPSLPQHEDLDAQHHARSFTRSTAAGPMTTHSHGAGDVKQKDKIARYFQQVGKSVDEALHGSHDPLILAGVDYLQAIYRQVNHPSNLVAAAITGNPDEWNESQIMTHAKPIVASLYDDKVKLALADYKAVNNTPRVTRAFKDIVRAASAGRIETLFVAQDAERWGLFNAETQQVQSHTQPKPGDEPLTNLTAVHVLRQRGQVVVLPRSQVPHGVVMAARVRY
jgi:Bacterial archaeo-eukaryotic release factor family 3